MVSDTHQDTERTGASLDEVSFFHSLAEKWTPLSEEIKDVRFKFGEDSDGDPAVWITVIVTEDLNPLPEKISRLQKAIESLRQEVLDSKTVRWPYIDIENESHVIP